MLWLGLPVRVPEEAAQTVKHLVIPDVQLKPGVPLDYIDWIAKYAVEKKPDVLVIIGDWADMPSLSSYDIGKKSFEGRTYRDDILAANDGLQRLMGPIEREQERLAKGRRGRWKLRKIVTLGNHENRINIAIENDRKLDGLISTKDIFFEQFGFEVYPFLKVVVVDGVAYSHYMCSGIMGRPITTARSLMTKMHMSCFVGHQPDRDIAYGRRADGSKMTTIISGSCYPYDMDYLNPQTNDVWHGVWMLNEVNNGGFDEMPVSLRYLKERYGS